MWKYDIDKNAIVNHQGVVIAEFNENDKSLAELEQIIHYANTYGLLLQDMINSLGIVGLGKKS